MPNHTSLASLFTDIADAIRARTGGSTQITADDFPTAIAAIPSFNVAKTTATGSGLRSISFSNLPGQPLLFYCYKQATTYNSHYRHIIAAFYDGTDLRGYVTGESGTSVRLDYRSSLGSFSYNNNILTIQGPTNYQWFSTTYELVMVY